MEQPPFPSTTFILSEKFVRRSQRALQFLALAIPVLMGMVFLLTPIYFSSVTPPCLGILLVLGLVGFGIATVWDPPNVKQRLANQRVTLNETALQLYHLGSTQTMRYEEMRQVKIGVDKAGEIQSIQIHSGDDACTLLGFEGMAQIAERLQAYVPDSAFVQRQPVWPNRSVWYHIAGLIVLVVLGIVLLIQLTEGAITEFTGWVFLVMGLYTLWRRPYSGRDGKQKRSTELFIGGMYVFLGVLSLNSDLQNAGGAAAIGRHPCHLIGQVIHQSGCVRTVASEDSVYFAADNRTILWSDSQWDEPRRVYVTGYNSWLGVWTPTWSYDELDQLLVSADGRTAVAIAADRTIVDVWDVASRSRRQHLAIKTYGSHLIGESVQLSADGRYLADKGITIWDLTTGQPVRQIASDAAALAFSPDGQYLAGATATSEDITIWRISDGTVWQQLTPPPTEGRSKKQLLFSPDGQWLLVGNELSSETAIEMAIWDLSTGERRYVWPVDQVDARYQLAFSPDNQFVVGTIIEAYWDEEQTRWTDSDQTQLYVWRLADGVLVKKQFLGFSYDYRPLSLDFSPDGSRLAVGLEDVGMVFRAEQLLSGFTVQD